MIGDPNHLHPCRHLVRMRGVGHRHERWAGCDGRLRCRNDERHRKRTAKSCGPGLSMLRLTGDDASHRAGMVTTKPDHRAKIKARKQVTTGSPKHTQQLRCPIPWRSLAKTAPVPHVPLQVAVPAIPDGPVSIVSFEYPSQPPLLGCCDDRLNSPSGIPARMVLTACFVLAPETGYWMHTSFVAVADKD